MNSFTQQEDNLICTFVKLYSFNIKFGLNRASQMLGKSFGSISHRYYHKLRAEREIFSVKFGDIEIWNSRRITESDINKLNLTEHEPELTEPQYAESNYN